MIVVGRPAGAGGGQDERAISEEGRARGTGGRDVRRRTRRREPGVRRPPQRMQPTTRARERRELRQAP